MPQHEPPAASSRADAAGAWRIVLSGGVGVGIDRVLIMFTGETIRETILFPLVRPE